MYVILESSPDSVPRVVYISKHLKIVQKLVKTLNSGVYHAHLLSKHIWYGSFSSEEKKYMKSLLKDLPDPKSSFTIQLVDNDIKYSMSSILEVETLLNNIYFDQ
jgi:hypothetical protein